MRVVYLPPSWLWPSRRAAGFPVGPISFNGPRDGSPKSLGRKGLEQVVDCIHLKGAEGIGIPGCGENDAGRGGTGQGVELIEQGEAVQTGHTNIEEEQLRRGFAHDLENFTGRGAFSNYFDSWDFAKHLA